MPDFHRLDDKNVLITGGADGIGLALAEAFAAGGARLFLADIAAEKLAASASKLSAASAPCDVTDPEAVERVVDRAWEEIGPIDLLCANAGVATSGSVLDASPEDIAFLFGVNVWGILNAVRPFVKRLRNTGRPGHILMTGSETSLSTPSYLKTLPTHLYSMTKHAVLSMGDSLRNELAAESIGVSVLCPGPVATNLSENSGAFRPERFGSATSFDMSAVSPEVLAHIGSLSKPAGEAAALALEGLRRELFVIPTHAHIRDDATARFREIERGFDQL